MQRAHGRRLVVTCALLVTLAGCDGATQGTLPPTPGPTAAPTPSPAPTPVPTRPAAKELVARKKNLDPGRYTRTGFVPRVTFVVDGSWRAVQVLGGFFEVQQDVDAPGVIAVQFARPDGVYRGKGQLMAPSTAAAAVEAIESNPEITILGTSESLMSGHAGVVVEVENPATATADARVLHVPPGALLISPGRRLWIALFDTPEGLLAILVGGSIAKWDEALAAAEPVLESVTIGL